MNSCSKKSDNKELDKLLIPPKNIISDDYTITISDSLRVKVHNDQHNTIREGCVYRDSILYGICNQDKYLIKKINLLTNKYTPIKIKEPFKIKVVIDKIYVDSLENIYITEHYPARIHKIDQKGYISETYSDIFNNPELLNAKDISYYGLLSISAVKSDKVFLTGTYGGYAGYMNITDKYRHFVFNLKTHNLESAYCKHNGVLAALKENEKYYCEFQHPSEIVVGNYNYISYPLDHYIYKYDLRAKMTVSKHPCNGSFAKKITSPVLVKSGISEQVISQIVEKKIRKEMPDYCLYGELAYHKGLNMFSRFSRSAHDVRYLIYNDQFNVIGECELPAKCYKLFATSTGYYAIPNFYILEQADYIDLYKLEIAKK